MTNKVCKECKHSVRDDYGYQRYEGDRWYCRASQETKIDPVTGEVHTIKTHKCYDMRSPKHECGPDGKLWEPK